VVLQFIISVTLIIASVVISNQMNYLRSTDLGFAKDQQIIIPLRSSNAKNIYPALKNEIKKNQQVQEAGATLYYPGTINPSDMGVYMEGKTVNEAKRMRTNSIDESFLQTLDLKLIAGRLFSSQFLTDTNNRVVLNENAVKEIGFSSPQKAIGSKIYFDWRGTSYNYTVVGVVKDFHFEDFHVPITPYGFFSQ